jgi:membrane-bound inhibitor of C-type lysozyme
MKAGEAVPEQGVDKKLRILPVLTALVLAACHPPAARSEGAPPPPAQGPVNPDAGVTTYRCMDGSLIVAGYPDAKTAVVTYKDHAYTLKLAPSASGQRYTGYGIEWRTEGGHGTITALKPGEEAATARGVDCTAQPQSTKPTKTSFRPS